MEFSIGGHMRFRKEEIEQVAVQGSKYITILRNPILQFQSSFNYYYGKYRKSFPERRWQKVSCTGEPFLSLLRGLNCDISTYLIKANRSLTAKAPWFFRSKNYQSFDLGMNPLLEDKEEIYKYIEKLDKDFDLIMIADHFLESLVLLKETLCMEWTDLKFAVKEKGRYKPFKFSSADRNIIRGLNKQDFMLYEHFNATFWRRVEKYGYTRMQEDIQKVLSVQNTGRSSKDERNGKSSKAKRSVMTTIKPRAEEWSRREFSDSERVANIQNKLEKGCSKKICANKLLIKELAQAMNNNYGWCPH